MPVQVFAIIEADLYIPDQTTAIGRSLKMKLEMQTDLTGKVVLCPVADHLPQMFGCSVRAHGGHPHAVIDGEGRVVAYLELKSMDYTTKQV